MKNFRAEFQEIIEGSFVPFLADENTINKKWNEVIFPIIDNMPKSLFRYRKMGDAENKERNIEFLAKAKLPLCHASKFSDKYDSYIYVDKAFIHSQMIDNMRDALRTVLYEISKKNPNVLPLKASKICYYKESGLTEEDIIEKIIVDEYSTFIQEVESTLKQRETKLRDKMYGFKIACFTESPVSKFMWDIYADGYKGYVLEYDFKKTMYEYNRKGLDVTIFPIIYSDQKYDATKEESCVLLYDYIKEHPEAKAFFYEIIKNYPLNQLYFYKTYLYKDKREYQHEYEWRMIYVDYNNKSPYAELDEYDSLKAIYYGPDIKSEDKEQLHRIAEKRGIKEYKVFLDTESKSYDLAFKDYV